MPCSSISSHFLFHRNEPDSNIRMQTTMNDKSNDYQTENSIDIRLIHATRQVGVFHKVNIDDTQMSSSGNIYWDNDDASKVFYNLQMINNSRRRKEMIDSSFKLGLPSRTLGFTSSYRY